MSSPRPRSRSLLAVLTAVAVGLLSLLLPATASASPYCGITWGSLAKVGNGNQPVPGAVLTNVRAGEQACYDRLVLDIRGTTSFASWRVEYVTEVTTDPGGFPVPLNGGAFLRIAVGAFDHTAGGTPTYCPADPGHLVNVTGFRTFQQVAWAGSSEGISSVGLGVRARLPFRAFALSGIPGSSNGTRVVVDVAHSW